MLTYEALESLIERIVNMCVDDKLPVSVGKNTNIANGRQWRLASGAIPTLWDYAAAGTLTSTAAGARMGTYPTAYALNALKPDIDKLVKGEKWTGWIARLTTADCVVLPSLPGMVK